MTPAPGALQKRMDQLKDGLRRSGVNVTHQRLEIFREVAKSGDHPDAETIFKGVRRRVPSVSLDTVYRTLWLLLDLRLLTSLGPPRERMRFDANMAPHHHFVCMTCGMTTDFYHEEFNGLKIPNAVKTLGRIETAHVEVKGICLKCSRKANPGRRARRKTENEY